MENIECPGDIWWVNLASDLVHMYKYGNILDFIGYLDRYLEKIYDWIRIYHGVMKSILEELVYIYT